jgi:hypothetical protein
VQLATSIVYAGDDWKSRFVKKDRLVIPNPIRAYKRNGNLIGLLRDLRLEARRRARLPLRDPIHDRTAFAVGAGETRQRRRAVPAKPM